MLIAANSSQIKSCSILAKAEEEGGSFSPSSEEQNSEKESNKLESSRNSNCSEHHQQVETTSASISKHESNINSPCANSIDYDDIEDPDYNALVTNRLIW